MTPDLRREFQLLSGRAQKQLKEVAESGSYRHVFSLWTMPSFSPSFRCTIYSPRPLARGKPPFASFSIWRSDLDLEKFRTPVERLKHPKDLSPTIEHDNLLLTDGEIEQIELEIRNISIPLFLGHRDVAGCDGTTFEFQYDDLLFGASLRWWSAEPKEWRPFTNVITRIVADLDSRWKNRT